MCWVVLGSEVVEMGLMDMDMILERVLSPRGLLLQRVAQGSS